MRRRHLLALVPALPIAVLVGACGRSPQASLGLALTFPQGLLDQATGMTLKVFDASLATCNAETGYVDGSPPAAQTQVFPLHQTGCTGGDLWCTTITLDKDGSTKMFSVVATKAGATLAEGCVTKVIDQDPLPVDIQAHPYSPPKCCGNGILEPGEQCDTGIPGSCTGAPPSKCSGMQDDAVCFCDCTAKEILLSIDDAKPPGAKNGAVGTKTNLALAFGPGGASNPTVLRAVFGDTDKAAIGGADVDERFLAHDLYPIAEPEPLSLQLRLPVLCSDVTGSGIVREQRAPALADASDDTVAIVYQSDEDNGGEDYDIMLNAQTADGCADTKPCAKDADCQTSCDLAMGTCAPAIKLNVTSGGCSDAHVAAGPAGLVLVTWTRKDGIFGRIWGTDGSLAPPAGELSIAPGGSAARVAGSSSGFQVVYQGSGSGDPDGVFFVTVDASGNPSGATLVNSVVTGLQDQPDIGMLDDGSTLIAWHSGGDVLFQRYDPHGKASADDQNAPLNTSGLGPGVDQQNPAVAGANGFFVVAWEEAAASGVSNVAARFVGTTGFGYNSVTGQNDEFVATDPATNGDRHLPAVALGEFTVIGWEDHAAAHHGVYARRFPPPAGD